MRKLRRQVMVLSAAGLATAIAVTQVKADDAVGLIGLACGIAGFIILHLVGYAIERRKKSTLTDHPAQSIPYFKNAKHETKEMAPMSEIGRA
jgi:hypothetical protein